MDGVNPEGSDLAYGPGEQGYVNQLKQYDAAWAAFFARLKNDGIDQSNTLFVILVEEGQIHRRSWRARRLRRGDDALHLPADPTTTPRVSKGEVAVDLDMLLSSQGGHSTSSTFTPTRRRRSGSPETRQRPTSRPGSSHVTS